MLRTRDLLEKERYFNFEKKQAKYDPKTGKIELYDANARPPKTIIKNYDDLEKERKRLHEEFKLSTEHAADASVDELAEGYQKMYELTEEGYEFDTTDTYAETSDHMRID